MKKLILLLMLTGILSISQGQILTPVKWSYGIKKIDQMTGVIFIKATIDEGWHVYSQTVPDGGPVKTTFTFEASPSYELIGKTIEPKPISRIEKVFDGMQVSFFENNVIFQQKVKLKISGPVMIKGSLEFMTCNDQKCLPPETVPFSVTFK